MVSPHTRDRAQLILVGALLLATVIFGLSMLLNSMLFTGASGDTGASAAVQETDFVDYDVEQGVRELVVRINHNERNRAPPELGTEIENQILNFSHSIGEARARSGSVGVSVRYNNSTSTFGRRVIQAENSDISSWEPVDGNAQIGWISLNANQTATNDGEEFKITASNSSPSSEVVTLTLQMDGSHLNVVSDPSWKPAETVSCESERGQILMDLYAGRGFTDDCSFTGIGALDRPTAIDFDTSANFVGKYELVTNQTTPAIRAQVDPCTSPTDPDPCSTPAVWLANITTHVEGDSVSYDNSYNLTVYTNER